MKHKPKLNWVHLIQTIGKGKLITCLIILFPLIGLCLLILDTKKFPFEKSFLKWLHQVIPPVFGDIFSFFYILGDTDCAGAIVAISLAILVWKRYWRKAMVLAIASAGILLMIDKLLKPFFERSRPPMRLDHSAAGYSFPSGHAAGNLVLYFLLAYLLSARFPQLEKYIYAFATLVVILIGLGSMYLRVHWPTDILAGYGLGYIWLTLCMTLLKVWEKKTKKFEA